LQFMRYDEPNFNIKNMYRLSTYVHDYLLKNMYVALPPHCLNSNLERHPHYSHLQSVDLLLKLGTKYCAVEKARDAPSGGVLSNKFSQRTRSWMTLVGTRYSP
jgi:hypothetical protein